MIVRKCPLRSFASSTKNPRVSSSKAISDAAYLCNRVHHLATSGSRTDGHGHTGGNSRKHAAIGIMRQLEDLLVDDPSSQRFRGVVADRLGNREIGKLLAGAATLKAAVPPKLLSEVLANHWLPGLITQLESSETCSNDLGSSLCIVLSALSRIKQQHPKTTMVSEDLLARVASLIEDSLTDGHLSTKDICSLLLYLSRLGYTSAAMFGSVVEKLDQDSLSCRDLADLLQAFSNADLISIQLLSNTLPHGLRLLTELRQSISSAMPLRDLSIVASAYSKSASHLPATDVRPFFESLRCILTGELTQLGTKCSVKDAIAFLVAFSRVGVDDDKLYQNLLTSIVLPEMATLDVRSAGYVLSAYTTVECQRRRRFQLQGLEETSNGPTGITGELRAALRAKASSLAAGVSAGAATEQVRVLVNYAYEFSRLDAGTGDEAEVMRLLETAICKAISGRIPNPHVLALAASAYSGMAESQLMEARLPESLATPQEGCNPLGYFSSRDLSIIASAAVKHSQLTGSTGLLDLIVSYVKEDLLSSAKSCMLSTADLATLAETLSPVDPEIVETLMAFSAKTVTSNCETAAPEKGEINALCDASLQSGALIPRLREIVDPAKSARVPPWTLEESSSILRCLVSLGCFGGHMLSSATQVAAVSRITSVVEASSVHEGIKDNSALPPWSSLVSSCCSLLLEHSDQETFDRGVLSKVLHIPADLKVALKRLLLALAGSAVSLEANPTKAIYLMWPILQAVSSLDSSIDRAMHLETCGVINHINALLGRLQDEPNRMPSPRYAALALHSLANLRFNRIPPDSLSVLLKSLNAPGHGHERLRQASPGDVSRALYALARLGLAAPAFSRSLHQCRFRTPWELTTVLHGLALLDLESSRVYVEAVRLASESRSPTAVRAQARQILTYHLATHNSTVGPLEQNLELLRSALRLFNEVNSVRNGQYASSSEMHSSLCEALRSSGITNAVVSSEVPAGPYQIDSVITMQLS
ncbi:hypothetical protein FOL47_008834 [Perkinsus chesapeaki]|uniref:Uncharacterized protein n=1 Tax=Perkinsus chesapeaki TaxID=330153 RepID=A0A7J6LBL4_PERCH|nr:hypothetical protein FOL47_008834 [Perkinsus chesapeaki]